MKGLKNENSTKQEIFIFTTNAQKKLVATFRFVTSVFYFKDLIFICRLAEATQNIANAACKEFGEKELKIKVVFSIVTKNDSKKYF